MTRRSLSAAAAITLALNACDRAPAPHVAAEPPPVPVTVALVARADAPILIRTVGSLQSVAMVTIRTQVEGRIEELPAREGTDVAAGDVLARLDARPYDAALRQAEANLARATAMGQDARNFVERLRTAMTTAAVSQREVEEAQARAAAAEAEALGAQAQVDTARLNLAYCTVTAPFAGRLGQFAVRPGSTVKANETDVVELAQIDPIEVAVSVPEQEIPAIRDAVARGPVRVEALPSGHSGEPAAGTLSFVDNAVDATTGTIRLKATFDNAQRRLWPGQFAAVTIVVGREPDAVTVPQGAVQPSQAGPAVFVVTRDGTVELRPVTVRRTFDGGSIIERGVEPGETVVTDGHLRLAPGTRVKPREPAGG